MVSWRLILSWQDVRTSCWHGILKMESMFSILVSEWLGELAIDRAVCLIGACAGAVGMAAAMALSGGVRGGLPALVAFGHAASAASREPRAAAARAAIRDATTWGAADFAGKISGEPLGAH